jgi:hypothetical protein
VSEVFVSQRVNVHLAATSSNPNGGIVVFYPGLNTVPPGVESEPFIANLIVASAPEVELAHQAQDALKLVSDHVITAQQAVQEAEKARLDAKTAAGEEWTAANQAAIDAGLPFSEPHPDPLVQRSLVLTSNHFYGAGIAPPGGGTAPPEVPPTDPPVNRDVPMVSGSGAVGSPLNCTMGNWDNMNTGTVSYAYQWQSGGNPVGDGSASYTPVAEDSGQDVTCVVTATNEVGSTAAPPSNAVRINGAGTHSARVLPDA